MKQHIPGLGREVDAAGQGGPGAAAPFPEAGAMEAQASGGKEQKLGSRLRGFLGGKKKEGGGSTGAAGGHGGAKPVVWTELGLEGVVLPSMRLRQAAVHSQP